MTNQISLRVKPKVNLRHANIPGRGFEVGKVYEATFATNLPDWLGCQKVFLIPNSDFMQPELMISLLDNEVEIVGFGPVVGN